jgi:hypothetical protein
MPGYMAGVVWDFSEFKKTGRIVLEKISSSPPPVDVDQLAKEALEDPRDDDTAAASSHTDTNNSEKTKSDKPA